MKIITKVSGNLSNILYNSLFITFIDIDGWSVKIGYNWVDQSGNDMTLKRVSNIYNHNDCKEACISTPDCVGYSFIGLYNYCNLKSELQAVKLNRSRVSVVSGKLESETNQIRDERSVGKFTLEYGIYVFLSTLECTLVYYIYLCRTSFFIALS